MKKIRLSMILAAAWAMLIASSPLRGESPADDSGKKTKLRLEISGGLGFIQPADINTMADADAAIHNAFFTSTYANTSYRNQSSGEFEKIGSALPFSLRLSYPLSRILSLSLGLTYLKGKKSSSPLYQFSGYGWTETKSFSNYDLTAEGLSPMLGIQAEWPLGSRLAVGAFIQAGPLWANCSHAKEWEWSLDNAGNSYFSEKGSLEMKGSGFGVAIDAGGRISYRLSKRFSLFVEGSYFLCRVPEITGTSSETRGKFSESREGRWQLTQETIRYNDWNLTFTYPAVQPADSANTSGFRLDLSGFQVRIGLSYSL